MHVRVARVPEDHGIQACRLEDAFEFDEVPRELAGGNDGVPR